MNLLQTCVSSVSARVSPGALPGRGVTILARPTISVTGTSTKRSVSNTSFGEHTKSAGRSTSAGEMKSTALAS